VNATLSEIGLRSPKNVLSVGIPCTVTMYRQTEAETRCAAQLSNDRQRRATEALLFGKYAPEIRYAALSLDGKGLVSYGSCSVALLDKLCFNKATLLEENSYPFVRSHRLLPGDDIPSGYRSVWKDRHWLTIAKLAYRISELTQAEEFAGLLLRSDGDRVADEFIEVHLYGTFGRQAFVGATIPSPEHASNDEEAYSLGKVRDLNESVQ
jgi:hypothetical protein